MINKKGLWFVTLFSLILVLSIYYITMPNDLFLTNNSTNTNEEKSDEKTKVVNKEVVETTAIAVLKLELEEERQEEKASYEKILNNNSASTDEKNTAYEKIKDLDVKKGVEENIEAKIKKNLSLTSFVKSNGSEISVVVEKSSHDVTLADEIMRLVQEEFQEKVSVTVKFV
jgi:hypothetical protein